MFGTAATSAVTLTPDILQRIPGYDSPNTGWDCILRDPLALNSQAANTIPVTHTLTLPGTDRTAHVCIFVSPSLILSPLRSFTPADGGQLYWEMGENLYTINGSLLSALNGSIADLTMPSRWTATRSTRTPRSTHAGPAAAHSLLCGIPSASMSCT